MKRNTKQNRTVLNRREERKYNRCILDNPTPMPESALLMATAQIMAEGGAKHSPVNCNIVSSKPNCAASKKAKSGAARKRGANLCFCAAAR